MEKEKTGFGVFASYFSALLLIIIFSICFANSPSAQTELFNPTQGEKSRVLRYSALRGFFLRIFVCATRHGDWTLAYFLRLMLFDLFCRFRGFVYMPARRPNMIRGVASYELRQEFCFRDGIRPCDPVSGHGMTVFFGLLRRYASRNDDTQSE